MRSFATPLLLLAALSLPVASSALAPGQVDRSVLVNAKPMFHIPKGAGPAGGHIGTQANPGTLGVDSVINFQSYFYLQDYPQDPIYYGFSWPYTMVGSSPFAREIEEPTVIDAPVVPVTVQLLDANGNVVQGPNGPLIVRADALVEPVLKSPVFSKTSYSSSNEPTQLPDAELRASFYNLTSPDWHTLLKPKALPAQTISVPYGFYQYALNPDGTCCDFMLLDYFTFETLLFPSGPPDNTTVMGALEVSGQINTSEITTLLFNNVYLYIDSPSACCVLGFHLYDFEVGNAANGYREKRYVTDYSSWITPGLFHGGVADVTALSHEMAEIFFDPFGGNQTPIWLAPNGNCQNNLEVGDVIENLPNGVYSVTLHHFTYHPQNVALLQWFAEVTPSNAVGGMYSYPNPVLTTPAYLANVFCQ